MKRTYLWAAVAGVAVLAGMVYVAAYVDFRPGPDPNELTYDPRLLDTSAPTAMPEDPTLTAAARRPGPAYGPSRRPTAAEAEELIGAFAVRPSSGGPARSGERLWIDSDHPQEMEDRARLWAGMNPGAPLTLEHVFRWQGRLNVGGSAPVDFTPSPTNPRALGEVVRVAFTPDRGQALIAVWAVRGDGRKLVRYRLSRYEGRWLGYDAAVGRPWLWDNALYADGEGEPAPAQRRGRPDPGPLTRALGLADEALDPDGLDRTLAPARGRPLPPTLAAWRAYAEGRLRELRGDGPGAVKLFADAVAADPTWPMGYTGRAQAFVRQGKYAEAFRDARAAAALVGP